MTLHSQLVQLSVLIGVVLPLLVAIVQQEKWSERVRVAVGVGSCLVAAVVAAAAKGELSVHDWATSATVIFLLTKTTYLSVWKPSGLAPAIEAATSRRPSLQEPE